MISYKCSYFLAFNEYEKLFFKNIIDGQILISGSVKSNIEVKRKEIKNMIYYSFQNIEIS